MASMPKDILAQKKNSRPQSDISKHYETSAGGNGEASTSASKPSYSAFA